MNYIMEVKGEEMDMIKQVIKGNKEQRGKQCSSCKWYIMLPDNTCTHEYYKKALKRYFLCGPDFLCKRYEHKGDI